MAYRLITCPESAHLEMIEYEVTPHGMVILSCSRFRPDSDGVCPRTCAARLDRRDGAMTRPVLIEARSLLRDAS